MKQEKNIIDVIIKTNKKLKKIKNLFLKVSEKYIKNGWYYDHCGNFNYSKYRKKLLFLIKVKSIIILFTNISYNII